MKKRTIKTIIGSIIILSLLLLIACTSPEKVTPPPYHIHPHLEIEINGQPQIIPPNIGLSPGHHEPIHTHEEEGVLHVESPVTKTFYLKEFFTIWNKKFDKDHLFNYTVDDKHELKVYVNGKEDTRFGNIILEDNQNIKIIYQKSENKT